MTKDYYATLGVAPFADRATIHSAFRTLARKYHPDAGTGSSVSKFQEALDAYRTLSDPARRREHDIVLRKSVEPAMIVAEPLFDPIRSRNHSTHATRFDFGDLVKEWFRTLNENSFFEF